MHGRPRVKPTDQQDPQRVKAAQEKALLLGKLLEQVLQRRQNRQYDVESLQLSAKLLELNPEIYTVWNYRREALGPIFEKGGEAAVETIGKELELTQRALMRNPKSYSTWHHRRWLVDTGFCSLTKELALVEQLLNADERNFHGWGYRRFIAQKMGMPAEQELEYTRTKIEQNFSNYSAWHYRTILLPIIYRASEETAQQQSNNVSTAAATASIPSNVLAEEYEFVKQAFYTEPEDQSGWFYHRWLMGCSMARWLASLKTSEETHEKEALVNTLATEKATCEELLDMEPDVKWPLLTLTRLNELERQVVSGTIDDVQAQVQGDTEVVQGYTKLKEEDGMRAGYYEDAMSGKAHVVAMPKSLY